ncbi:MAG: 23S rRNA (adenine(2503)-C(2))-methyltransferase RlmN, partial [Myxococcales bacterium]|nr:23S rRNA (adenine(2503)-C(2))-methyltransferase RlmN [Myxococcales bacterium]
MAKRRAAASFLALSTADAMNGEPSLYLKDYSPRELRTRFSAEGLPAYRADQVSAWVYRRGVEDPSAMSDLDRRTKELLIEGYRLRSLEVEEVSYARDGTVKAILAGADGQRVEAVLIPEEERLTLCVSSQVGCALACSFCATGELGFRRNLRAAEIVDQFCVMRSLLPERPITNVVFMGMGEPLLNLPAVVSAIDTLVDAKGLGLAPRRVTVSTAGLVPRILELTRAVRTNLAVSLHAANDELRNQLVPLNRRFPLEVLFDTLERVPRLSRRHPIFFEYTLLAGINDAPQDAHQLLRWLRRV